MARCEQGYLCDVCGDEVEEISESSLYLRFVTGQLSSRQLLSTPDRHLRCDPVTSQFICCAEFEPVFVEGDFDRRLFPPEQTQDQIQLLTRGWQRLQELAAASPRPPLAEYPLPEFQRNNQ
ncbi:MAG: hypothetical protein KDA96_09635 [Planctomycetaceae bacterium]|nr:hypothetical protein [Planctomycetaceae bacterium]MCA9063310.1 hypothetical protein [Planctomycetaceae bacterium]